jgi:predicted small lipoprotein YifL
MNMLKHLTVLTLAFVMSVAAGQLVGCGQKGPLYLPLSELEPEPAPADANAEKSVAKPEKTKPKASTDANKY